MRFTDSQLKILLLGSNLISYNKLEQAMKAAAEKNLSLIDYLPGTDLVSSEQLGRIIADALKISFANLREEKIDEALLGLIPEKMARAKGMIIIGKTDEYVKIGMTDPGDFEARRLLEKKLGARTQVFYITKQDLEYALAKYKGSAKDELKGLLTKLKSKNLIGEERDSLIVKIVDLVLSYGYQSRASDVHIEPYSKEIIIRFRIDGIMHDVITMSKKLLELIMSRIKIMAKMRTDEHRAAQDGKFRYSTALEDIDVRVSVLPTVEGEKTVMRLLSSKNRQFSLTDLGLSDDNLDKVLSKVKNPHGMILVTGPTGSGKTTTIYGVLKILNKREVNISSIEDPVEYEVEGVNQIQVNNKANLTFANGLRSLLRQDPDIIMVGEIRDNETAEIAVNSALTGHLVLSTLHTNDAATTLPRFLEMGIEPFLVASTINIAIAQRLVRKICTKCISSYRITDEEISIIEGNAKLRAILELEGYKDLKNLRFYRGTGCSVCSNTGYAGRLGIFEILEMSDKIRELVVARADSDKIMAQAKSEGMTTMLHDGARKIFLGQTTLMEVVRVMAK